MSKMSHKNPLMSNVKNPFRSPYRGCCVEGLFDKYVHLQFNTYTHFTELQRRWCWAPRDSIMRVLGQPLTLGPLRLSTFQ